MSYIISIDSDEEDDVVEFRKQTQTLLEDDPRPQIIKKLAEVQCPICFDNVDNATTTMCGHVFCLDCLQQSVSSSNARGQVRGKSGIGLCPLCRKKVAFKDSTVLKMKVQKKDGFPQLDESSTDDIVINAEEDEEKSAENGEGSVTDTENSVIINGIVTGSENENSVIINGIVTGSENQNGEKESRKRSREEDENIDEGIKRK